MLIGVLSDSHDNVPRLREAVSLVEQRGAEHILHAGDFVAPFAVKVLVESGLPFTGVYGNCDGEIRGIHKLSEAVHQPPHLFSLGGRRIALVHNIQALPAKVREAADVVVHGHTHKCSAEAGPPLVLNPGEVGGWVTGTSTAALLDLDALEVTFLEL